VNSAGLATCQLARAGFGDQLAGREAMTRQKYLRRTAASGPEKLVLEIVLKSDVAGTVETLGPDVKGVEEGSHVVIAPGLSCGTCRMCQTGWDSLCPEYKILGFQVDGGYAEFVKVPAKNLISATEQYTWEEWAADENLSINIEFFPDSQVEYCIESVTKEGVKRTEEVAERRTISQMIDRLKKIYD